MSKAFQRVLIANRGEIACRIIRACQSLGLETLAVYSEADREAPHVSQADRAFCIGPAPASASYLNIPRLLEIAKQAGAEALHPGYGFLAENPHFANACAQAGLVFIGPSVAVLESMGAKTAAREKALEAGLPVVPGFALTGLSPEAISTQAEALGYPLLVKAVGGGGGRGMRLVKGPEQLENALQSAAQEAQKSFSDARIYLEKYLHPVRHIEFQILGDQSGQVIHLGERECSIQRRYQKIIEEAPAPHFHPKLREAMGESALKLARLLHYVGAGTIEFILDSEDHYYFLEVNPRIQVEHPVTEAITGLDLVQWQIRLAQGEPLPLSQAEVQLKGHALEVRICAEDAQADFCPATGQMKVWELPGQLRIENGIQAGQVISSWYDSLLAKMISHADNREQALAQMKAALRKTRALGVSTNLQFLEAVCSDPEFQSGNLHTRWLESKTFPSRLPEALWMAALIWRLNSRLLSPLHLLGLPKGWRNLKGAAQHEFFRYHEKEIALTYRDLGNQRMEYLKDQSTEIFEILGFDSETLTFEYQNERFHVRYCFQDQRLWLYHPSWGNLSLEPLARLRVQPPQTKDTQDFHAQMPGRVLKIVAEIGKVVNEGETLLILESMKMETALLAPGSGKIIQCFVDADSPVTRGQKLLLFQLNSEDEASPVSPQG
ncbi:3-methylcrotonyl-CoA carboxylase [bacterium (Candidatus Blackallbacteria) CG17_big_fil_post_rev_8_21_14_2_50_48_46]|uniref:3-methylcrotonyl-CoA carboxylase n=1 Tax=bacterium (Candidatus Blackallbacteria) CG17_big_fil_post_rev_8_21_14_2_50_48_46 TaxID=2014261 RepID=A0A2M7G6N4_9BACT|nr:MAG: 3-methylcrotonyl-CoA carboxylase [bacterium (Candidatus Blackallbacteria) CG18_big_fil_WC_8_21_14_2_50_49_26]PIW17563.1 MAG: 3-methylcrotonyl-CoA carboxylase [bacterium (Candidatus Blackallbacteria) CG17_big_fil_post_rev_8_21_14_2_50_48_46]PIW48418.1 MAG: 3-methylcrotonyl-CoA carboxylase [bacterium (Candidatus Blackallbacteria) CG13_big_fil_rev_8_21_14_2_50_49_14]